MTCNLRSVRLNSRRLKHMQKKMVHSSPARALFCVSMRGCHSCACLLPPYSPFHSSCCYSLVLTRPLQASWPWKLRLRQPTMSMTCLLQLVILFFNCFANYASPLLQHASCPSNSNLRRMLKLLLNQGSVAAFHLRLPRVFVDSFHQNGNKAKGGCC